jgi:tetratricopeptide (TPR) repeat protein
MIALLLGLLFQGDDIATRLQNLEWKIRRNAAQDCGTLKLTQHVPNLIQALKAEEQPEVRTAVLESLATLTGKSFPDATAWSGWWELEGAALFRKTVYDEKNIQEAVRKLLEPTLNEVDARVKQTLLDVDNKVKTAKSEIRYLSVGLMVVGVIFVLVMLYFVGHVSSKLKEWKELVAKAEVYILKSAEITQRTDRIIAELDSKKADIMAFLAKSKEDSQSEFERYCDILEKNLEHKMREEVMGLRQKAEKELEQTLGELRTQVDHEIRRGANEHREKMDKEVTQRRQSLMKDIEAEQRYMQAKSLLVNDRPDEALTAFKQLVADKPDHILAWNDLASVYQKLKRYEEAVEACQRALGVQPNNPKVLYTLATAFARLRQRDKMIEKLALSVAGDKELKDEALNDAAFREYWSDPKFRDLCEA